MSKDKKWDWDKADTVGVSSDGSWSAEQVRTGDKGMTVHVYSGSDATRPEDHDHTRETYGSDGESVKVEVLHD